MAVYLNQAQIDLIRGRACIVYLRRQLASTARRRGERQQRTRPAARGRAPAYAM